MIDKIAILQSNYIPWKGYFDIINSVDEFIWYDDVKYSKNGWRNRNRIIAANGVQWMDYTGYPEYQQLHGNFEHAVTILDLLFNLGDEAPWYIWGWRESAENKNKEAN